MQMHAMWLQAASPIWTLQSTSNGTDVIANLVCFFFFFKSEILRSKSDKAVMCTHNGTC